LLIGIGINRENLQKNEIFKLKNKFNKFFNVPIVEPLSEGVGEIIVSLEEL